MLILIPIFALVALIYASVGFGGGSTYTALLALSGVEYGAIPVVSLLCNIIVVAGGCWRYARARLIDLKAIAPLLLASAPLAFIGGRLPVSESAFYAILGGALLLSACALLLPTRHQSAAWVPPPVLWALSGIVGLLAGLSGIGGGIFMAPMLHLIRWADARRIAAFASVYILINSIAGIAGQLTKSATVPIADMIADHWPLLIAVLIGGQLGSHLGTRWLAPNQLRMITAILVGYVALRLIFRG
jgi:uncharacterized membrane protein YfcA